MRYLFVLVLSSSVQEGTARYVGVIFGKTQTVHRDWDFPEDHWLDRYVISRPVTVGQRHDSKRLKIYSVIVFSSLTQLIKSLRQFRIVSLTKMQRLIRRADACKICYYTLRLSSMM